MATKYEMSKTYQYRKVMKPLLERKRRARINKCLDELKELMAERMQQESGDPNVKLEKADILELTVNHLHHMKTQRHQESAHLTAKKSFRSGYIHAANEVSRCLATLPNVNIVLGTQLMTHLGLRLNQLESPNTECTSTQDQPQQQENAINKPLNVDCSFATSKVPVLNKQPNQLYSPGSSGYESDSDCSRFSHSSSSPMTMGATAGASQGLLQMAEQVWRPW